MKQVREKVEESSTFCSIAKPVEACNMSTSNLQCFVVISIALQVAEKTASCNRALKEMFSFSAKSLFFSKQIEILLIKMALQFFSISWAMIIYNQLICVLNCFRHKWMWGWGGDKSETVDMYECKVYSATGVEVVTKTRVEHLADDDKREARGTVCIEISSRSSSVLFNPQMSEGVKWTPYSFF